jgi:hypothetical protein
MTTRFDVEEFRETVMQFISARNQVEQLDGATLAQPAPEELEELLQSLQNANYISTAGLASHYPAEGSQGASSSQPAGGDSMDVDTDANQQQQQNVHITEGPAEMQSDDEGIFGGPRSPDGL